MWKPYLKYGDPRHRYSVDPSIGNSSPCQLPLGETPPQGFTSEGEWGNPFSHIWKHHPSEGGRLALCRFSDAACVIGPTMVHSYYTAIEMFKEICEFLRRMNPKWTLHCARNWPPECANQLGWSEDGHRGIGHWVIGSQMMERYDRALRATELRLGG